MKKYLSMICCLAVLFTAGCGDDDTGGEDGPKGEAKLTAFSFTAESNPDCLVKDYTGTISGTAVSVKVPAGTDVSALVATFETADGESTVTVGGTPQVSGTTANDFSDPVDYLVNLGKKNALYTVTVSELPEAVWTKVTEWEQKVTKFQLEIKPTNNMPCLALQVPGEDAPGPVLYAELDGSNFSIETATEETAQYPGFGFTKTGQPYIFYYSAPSKTERFGHITTFSNGKWNLQDISIIQPLTTGYGPTICEASNGNIFVFTANNVAGANTAKRALNLTIFDGTSWTTDQTIPGRTGYTYWPIARTVNDILYLMVLNPASPSSVSVYSYSNGTWQTIIDQYAHPKTEDTFYTPDLQCPDMVVDKNGDIYMAICYEKCPTVLKYTAKTKEINVVATPMPMVPSSSTGTYCRAALSPLGALYLAYFSADSNDYLQVVSLDDKTKEWTTPIQIGTESIKDFEFKFAKDGTAYLVYNVSEEKTDEVVTTPAKVCLYKLATAE